MLDFYKKALLGLLLLLAANALVAYLCLDRTFLQLALIPGDKSNLPWHSGSATDDYQGGKSTATVYDDNYSLDFGLNLSTAVTYPFASVAMIFEDEQKKPRLQDLSSYTRVSFRIKCTPANVLNFSVFTVDEQITRLDDLSSYRTPTTFFSCDEHWKLIELDLTRLEIPQWWIDRHKLKLSMKDYTLNKVLQLQFGSTYQGPSDVDAQIQINELTLKGRDWHYLYLFGVFLALSCGAYVVWFFRQHTRALINDLKIKIQKERPLVAYQQLSVESQHDKDKSVILQFLSTHYANPELSVDAVVTAIGVSRTKINDILKAELGFTFSSYLNKLRLTEAARLLLEKDEVNIAEIAYSVGYNNASYFNKLFKEEYGCTPNTFKSVGKRAYTDQEQRGDKQPQ